MQDGTHPLPVHIGGAAPREGPQEVEGRVGAGRVGLQTRLKALVQRTLGSRLLAVRIGSCDPGHPTPVAAYLGGHHHIEEGLLRQKPRHRPSRW